MKILVTGGSGLLGKYLHMSEPPGLDVHYTWFSSKQPWCAHRLNIYMRQPGGRTRDQNQRQIDYVFGKVKPDAVVHMAGVGNVDFCQQNYQLAWDTNVEGTRHVMKAAADHGAQVLLTSTNAVFSGENPPYGEDDPREPVNAYGKIRKAAEDVVLREGGYVARLFLLYGWEPEGARGNWASGAVQKLQAGQKMRVVNDRWYMPTYAADAAQVVWALLGQGQGEGLKALPHRIYHVAGADRVTLYDFVKSVAEQWSLDPSLVEPCSFDDLPGLAPRPVDSCYRLERMGELDVLPCRGIEAGLGTMRLAGQWAQWEEVCRAEDGTPWHGMVKISV